MVLAHSPAQHGFRAPPPRPHGLSSAVPSPRPSPISSPRPGGIATALSRPNTIPPGAFHTPSPAINIPPVTRSPPPPPRSPGMSPIGTLLAQQSGTGSLLSLAEQVGDSQGADVREPRSQQQQQLAEPMLVAEERPPPPPLDAGATEAAHQPPPLSVSAPPEAAPGLQAALVGPCCPAPPAAAPDGVEELRQQLAALLQATHAKDAKLAELEDHLRSSTKRGEELAAQVARMGTRLHAAESGINRVDSVAAGMHEPANLARQLGKRVQGLEAGLDNVRRQQCQPAEPLAASAPPAQRSWAAVADPRNSNRFAALGETGEELHDAPQPSGAARSHTGAARPGPSSAPLAVRAADAADSV